LDTTHLPAKGVAPEKKSGKSGLSNLKTNRGPAFVNFLYPISARCRKIVQAVDAILVLGLYELIRVQREIAISGRTRRHVSLNIACFTCYFFSMESSSSFS
jgi:hypothetical protein